MFRYDRPQAGRYRQLHQHGVEAVGCADPECDVEVISLLYTILQRLQLKNLHLQVNSIGDLSSRAAYKEALHAYLSPHLANLSKESQHRFEKNILRILDSKDPKDQEILQNAPNMLDFLSSAAKNRFERVLALLDTLAISYDVQPKLVRGLDYYTDTVFEVLAKGLGAQNAIGGGGRYDGLSETLGGPTLPAVGFSIGLERMIQLMLKQGVPFSSYPHPKVFLIPLGDNAKSVCFKLMQQLRSEGIAAECSFREKKMGQALQLANTLGAEYALIIGDNELKTETAMLKHLDSRKQSPISFTELIPKLKVS
jgi:histidyl-tRNA synthetase